MRLRKRSGMLEKLRRRPGGAQRGLLMANVRHATCQLPRLQVLEASNTTGRFTTQLHARAS